MIHSLSSYNSLFTRVYFFTFSHFFTCDRKVHDRVLTLRSDQHPVPVNTYPAPLRKQLSVTSHRRFYTYAHHVLHCPDYTILFSFSCSALCLSSRRTKFHIRILAHSLRSCVAQLPRIPTVLHSFIISRSRLFRSPFTFTNFFNVVGDFPVYCRT